MRRTRASDPPPELSAELRAARRAIIGVDGVELLRDWEWHRASRKWVLLCRLTPANVLPGGLVPPSTDWFVRASPAYPLGAVKFNPAKRNGLTQTFPHQSYNEAGRDEIPWRTGAPCLDTPTRILGRHDFTIEPFEAHKRLRWHVRRALGWLEAASRGELIVAGEPFELPQYPVNHT